MGGWSGGGRGGSPAIQFQPPPSTDMRPQASRSQTWSRGGEREGGKKLTIVTKYIHQLWCITQTR